MNNKNKNRIVKLSKRLSLVASFVPRGGRIADVGTDHGYLPIYLAQMGEIRSALALDVREGPLERAGKHIEEYGMGEEGKSCKICTRLSNGLQKLSPGEADTVIMAGMGGSLIVNILEQGRHMWDSVAYWILSPQSEPDKVRRFLAHSGFQIEKEAMVKEEGKFYVVLRAVRGEMEYKSQAEYLYGRLLIEEKDKVLAEFLEQEKKRIKGILEILDRGEDSSRASETNRQRAQKELLEELSWIEEAKHEMQ